MNSGCKQRTRVMSWPTEASTKSMNCRNMWRGQIYRISMYTEQQISKRGFSEDPFSWCSRNLGPWTRSMTLANGHLHLKKNGLKAKLHDSKGHSTASTMRFFCFFVCLFCFLSFLLFYFVSLFCWFSVFLFNLFWFVGEVARAMGRSQETGL